MKSISYSAIVVFISALLLSFTAGCKKQQPEKQPPAEPAKKIKVYTTIYPVYDFTVKVGGEKAEVISMVPPGGEPHEWEPKPRDLAGLGEADVLIYCGAGMEPWIDKALKNISVPVVVDASQGVELLEESQGHDHDHGHGGENNQKVENVDPHIWLDPLNAVIMVGNVRDALVKADPANSGFYQENAAGYSAQLELLHGDYRAALEKAPKKVFVTSHAAFGYLAHRYGLRQVPIRGISPEVEPAPGRVAEIIKTVRREQISHIFFETLVSPKVSQVIAAETGARVLVLNPLGGLSQDEINAGKDYLAVMRENLANLKVALEVKE